ncbi:hypothetical protein MRX96_022007 [Rhipicephalus microplus]
MRVLANKIARLVQNLDKLSTPEKLIFGSVCHEGKREISESCQLSQGHEVHHCHYSALLECEEQQAGLRAIPKLTRAHIFPNAFQQMSVRLAVQASNHS